MGKNLTVSISLYRLLSCNSALVLSSTRNGAHSSAAEKRQETHRGLARALAQGHYRQPDAPRGGILMTLREYQESPGGATCIYAPRCRRHLVVVSRGVRERAQQRQTFLMVRCQRQPL